MEYEKTSHFTLRRAAYALLIKVFTSPLVVRLHMAVGNRLTASSETTSARTGNKQTYHNKKIIIESCRLQSLENVLFIITCCEND